MKNQRPKCTATERVAIVLKSLLAGGGAWAAQVVGVVTHLSGPLLDRKADGSVKVLGLKSEVESGDTLVSEKNTYAQIRFVDNSEMTLKPGTTFRIENFSYDADKPDADSAAFSLVKGGLRSVTGLLGKRNKEKFSLKTPSATIGIRGTTFVVQYVPPAGMPVSHDPSGVLVSGKGPATGPSDAKTPNDRNPGGDNGGDSGRTAQAQVYLAQQAVAAALQAAAPPSAKQPPGAPPSPPAGSPPVLPPGLHLSVTDGAIVVTNNGGSLNFAAGQFGYVPSVNQPPVIVPSNPNIQFVPPPSFGGAGAGPQASGGGSPDRQAVDCIVR